MTDEPVWSQALIAGVQTALHGRNIIHFAGSTEFLNSEHVYFTAAAQSLKSAAVARPTSTHDVSALLEALRLHLPKDVPSPYVVLDMPRTVVWPRPLLG